MANTREKEQFLRFLRGRGQRVTGERLALFDEIFSQHGHIDAEELLGGDAGARARRSRAPRSTATSTCWWRAAWRASSGWGAAASSTSTSTRGQQHDHLVCTGCGRVVEFVSPGIAALQAEICRAHGFVPVAPHAADRRPLQPLRGGAPRPAGPRRRPLGEDGPCLRR